MNFEGWNWSLIGSVAGLFTTILAVISLLGKFFRRERKPKLTEEEKLQRKHAKTRSSVDQSVRAPDQHSETLVPLPGGRKIPVTMGTFGMTLDEASQAMLNMHLKPSQQAPKVGELARALHKMKVLPLPEGPPNVLIREGSTKEVPVDPPAYVRK